MEISIFGPGYGESVVAHLGNGEWIVIDSCVDAGSRKPCALEYLEQLGVDASKAIKRVIASHWHDDHIRGLGDIFKEAAQAEFWCSMALSSKEWVTLVETQRSNYTPSGSGVREMRKVMDELRLRVVAGGVASFKFAIEGRPLFRRSGGIEASVTALAPSDPAVSVMQQEFVLLLDQAKRRVGMLPSLSPNDSSIVLSVRAGELRVLLGSDLEERGKPGLGWTAVLQHTGTPADAHEGFKIPHHGSITGHHPEVWGRLMSDSAWAVVTPWARGKGLPTELDAKRIITESRGNAYITAPPHRSKYLHPDPAVQRTLFEMSVKPRKDIGKQGHVRLRRNIAGGNPWSVELFGDACHLAKVHWS